MASHARYALRISSLHLVFEASNKKVQDIALKAIQGTSGMQALTRVNKVAMEQAKKQPQA